MTLPVGQPAPAGTINNMGSNAELYRAWPKVVLHDHLDGGLRADTLFELADNDELCGFGYTSPDELTAAITAATNSGSLGRYLEAFAYTTAVLQSDEALYRVAQEAVEDLAADGVVYTELRFAPHLHLERATEHDNGFTMDDAVSAVLGGINAGVHVAQRNGTPIDVNLILSAMRNSTMVPLTAAVAQRWHNQGVVGFDLAGAEAGNPASKFATTFSKLIAAGVPLTIHAGEAAGVDYIGDALDVGAVRLGHGTALAGDITIDDAGAVTLGELAGRVRELHTCLEVCPSSNVHTGAVGSYAEHPINTFLSAGLGVTVSCDNRLMSNITLSEEYALLADTFGWGRREFHQVNMNAAHAAFCDPTTHAHLVTLLDGTYTD